MIRWLRELSLGMEALAGCKATRLGELRKAGLPVPDAFCLTVRAWQAAHGGRAIPEDLRRDLAIAWERLGASAVAVRSSSPFEDEEHASFAGQYTTVLNVTSFSACQEAIHRVWASAENPRQSLYAPSIASANIRGMAVLIQHMVQARCSGVIFSANPFGRSSIIIEVVPGLGDGLTDGHQEPERIAVDHGHIVGEPTLLTLTEISDLLAAVEAIVDLFGTPQDIEWAIDQAGKLWILQSRPITTGHDVFTEAGAQVLWTSGFLNERFTAPVSPLGWSVVREVLEDTAFRDPLRFMGAPPTIAQPCIRLYNGHPYVNAYVMWTLYRPFPDALLPEDARRYFPNGDVSLRHRMPYPRGWWHPRLLVSLLRWFLTDPLVWSPAHNLAAWRGFLPKYEAQITAFTQRLVARKEGVDALVALAKEVQRANRRLLEIHRWSLTYADLTYTILRRLTRRWLGETADTICAQAVADIHSATRAVNAAMSRLADLQREGSPQMNAALQDFLAMYGHRSASLDIMVPPYRDDPSQIFTALRGQTRPSVSATEWAMSAQSMFRQRYGGFIGGFLFSAWHRLVAWTQAYMGLREEQRFIWQKGLALLRDIYLSIARKLMDHGLLLAEDDIFFLTTEEVARVACGGSLPNVQHRRRAYDRLMRLWRKAPAVSYPTFLQGDEPAYGAAATNIGEALQGIPVSPGVAQGPACILLSPGDFGHIPDGCVLVVPSIDPAWTPLFGRVAGLLAERGGQLSHGAVVAREYHLPAVTGIEGATLVIREGELLTVDGNRGVVLRGAGHTGG